jgi:hypothetical protein
MLPDGGCACGGTEDLIQCVDCFTVRVSCRPCCLKAHRMLPFHRIKRWNGNFFARSSLFAQGHIIHLGHEGGPCPKHEDCLKATGEDEFVEGLDLLSQEEGDGKNLESEENWFSEDTSERVVTIVHTTGVFQHRVHWCSCLSMKKSTFNFSDCAFFLQAPTVQVLRFLLMYWTTSMSLPWNAKHLHRVSLKSSVG